jgi:tripartite-type tricarboxylate transporter receptor subunit TctC
MPWKHSLLIALAGAALAFSAPARANDYPSKPIRLIVPFPPGGINDVVGRIVATHLGERLGKQVIVDNRSGAGGIVGTELAANAPKDGYTLLIISIASAVNPWLYKVPYEPVASFAPVAILVSAPTVIVVNPDLPAKSIKELVSLAKQKPGDLTYATSGIGTSLHLAGELFRMTAGVDILHVPFRGASPALIDVAGGHSKIAFGSVTSTIPLIRSGKVRALGVGDLKRSAALPDVPTVAEAGVPGYEAGNWIGIVAPAGTPPDIVAKLNREISALQDQPEVQKQFANEGADIVKMTPDAFGDFMRNELAKWGRVIKTANIKAE